ncbi:hypothetical protein [Peribacillus sp. V2I11]|uniref:hypothetical protein n=1 Tax=Peribacillus sp. V2I11 TaxID=3042277 RepID=UPI00277F5799|nr:hypothetical protein [Peribacillus sp. V2I11]MDQ0879841.1 hypothetical protein [Peribacillus sp. V2I11]
MDTVNEFVRVTHLRRYTYFSTNYVAGIGQEPYEERGPVVNLVPNDYIIQAAATLALYKEGSGENLVRLVKFMNVSLVNCLRKVVRRSYQFVLQGII